VSIIKFSKVVNKKSYEKSKVVAVGANMGHHSELGHHWANTSSQEPSGGGTVTIQGMIVAGTAGHETSWSLEGVVAISVRNYRYPSLQSPA